MANFDVLKNFITQRVHTNGTQAITGQVMQDTLLEMLKAWGYQFQGFATPETVPPATANDYRPYYLANVKGTYTNFGGAVLDGSTLAMLYYDGSWKSQVLSMGGGGGTGNYVTLNTTQTITGQKFFNNEVGINNNNIAIYPAVSRSMGILYRKGPDASIYGGFGVRTTNSNEIEKLYMGWSSTPWDDSYNFCVSSSYIKYKNNTVWHAGNDGAGSGLDADLLDGLHNTAFARCDQNPIVDLDTIKGYGIMRNGNDADATEERHYPIKEAGTLFYGEGPYHTNQIYGSYRQNRWFARGGGGGGSVGMTSWREFVFQDTLNTQLGNYVTLNTTQTITGQKFFNNEVGINNNNIAIYPAVSRSMGILYRKGPDASIYGGFGVRTTNSNEIEKLYMGWSSTPWDDSYNFCVSSSYIKYKNNTVWHAGNDGAGSRLDADLLDGIHANGLFTALSNSGNYISMTIGGTTKTLVPAYATNAGSLGGNAPSYYATASGYVKKTGDTMTGTLTLDTISSKAPYLTFSTQLYIGNATDTNNTVNQGSIRTTGGISAALSIWAGKNITASGEVTAISDIRTKSDIRSLTFRGACRPVSFIKDGKRGIGFIAQEVHLLYPELVVEGADGLLSLNYAGYTAVLQSQVDNHETELQRLRGRVEELERRMRN